MPDIPKGAKTPTDHEKSPAQTEAEGAETTVIHWRGHEFTVPASPDDWPVDVLLIFEKGQNANGLQLILGPKQWGEFMKTKPLKRDVVDLFDTMGETLGVGN